ncbi:hypothetical protein J3R30DRAFT_3408679 [Lentinula aciculospora]|uniref:Uncharacterized protein n=1 Tax=Lentinula aciculospora TaxID=153920 RepID=A0A9W8ZYG4_9AGAR|nr:hypothetical protein J3R30DRAFT_3408679 [Lentinula aciculospora]
MTSAAKNAEFARLFELFEKLASRRSRATDVEEPLAMDDPHILSIPTDLQPVFRNLATLVTPRTASASARRERRNTIAGAFGSDGIDTNTELVANFPIGKQYPFKFKMMLHKLYELEDWRTKVREVLERSQKEFKPLAETIHRSESREDEGGENGPRGAATTASRVHFSPEFVGNSPPKQMGRPRSHTVASESGRGKELASRNVGSAPRVEPRDDERAVKKRCVGRRKSMSGISGEFSTWVFDSTVASSEINERVESTVPSTILRYGALQEDGRKRVPTRRMSSVASTTPIIDEIHHADGRRFKKRRATSVAVVKRS